MLEGTHKMDYLLSSGVRVYLRGIFMNNVVLFVFEV